MDKLDAALVDWIDSLPAHRTLLHRFMPRLIFKVAPQVRWDPNRKNILHFRQSLLLRAVYYGTQLLAHQPLVRSQKFSSSSPSSAIICSGAARASVHMIYAARERLGTMLRTFTVRETKSYLRTTFIIYCSENHFWMCCAPASVDLGREKGPRPRSRDGRRLHLYGNFGEYREQVIPFPGVR